MNWNKIIILFLFIFPCFLSAQTQNDGPFRIELQAPEEEIGRASCRERV